MEAEQYEFYNPVKGFWIWLRGEVRRRLRRRRAKHRRGDLPSLHKWLDSREGQEWARETFR